MTIRSIAPASFAANCYLIIEDGHALVVDPAVSLSAILQALGTEGASCDGIVLTHGHFDHMLTLDELRRAFPDAPVYVHEGDASFLGDSHKNAFSFFFQEDRVWKPADKLLRDGDGIPLGGKTVRVLHTPGHTPGSICLVCGEDDLITGDTLFDGNYGRYDLWGGNLDALIDSMRLLATLPETMTIYPGHGGTAQLGGSIRMTGLI
ncbi:MAG: MBL fold metallo-hydrolase [Clostridia bacterium]|nr:MBL fold metallo-hydrolase [Clostridia bacterium]